MRDAFDARRAAVLDSSGRVFIGHDLFYFADAASRARFVRNPLRYCRQLTDPVTRRRFKPSSRSPRAEFGGRPYYFSSDSTCARFKAAPQQFQLGAGGMTR